MDIIEIIAKLAEQGAAIVLAVVVIHWNRKDSKEYAQREREHAQRERDDKLLLMKALQENTEVLTELKTLVKRMNGR